MMHALVDVEAEIAEPGLVREIRGRDALVDAAVDQAAAAASRSACVSVRVEEGLEPVERQMQRVQDQIRRLVVGIGRAVAETQARLR